MFLSYFWIQASDCFKMSFIAFHYNWASLSYISNLLFLDSLTAAINRCSNLGTGDIFLSLSLKSLKGPDPPINGFEKKRIFILVFVKNVFFSVVTVHFLLVSLNRQMLCREVSQIPLFKFFVIKSTNISIIIPTSILSTAVVNGCSNLEWQSSFQEVSTTHPTTPKDSHDIDWNYPC